ncbi:hypothetical protein MKX08_005695 [Trichoderma sp. CBMAI-0020]|nr:hypothetical protein MKX08_005695 [Trichoderma sp. CBMAI-0020]
MTKGQRQKYLWYLQKTHINHFVAKPFECHGGTVAAHSLYQRARDDAGNHRGLYHYLWDFLPNSNVYDGKKPFGDFIHRASCDSSSTASETGPSRGSWNIETVIEHLAVSKTRPSSAALESSQKRTKLSDDNLMSHLNQRLNQHAEAIQKIVHEAQLEEHSKLQEVHHDVEKGVQSLNGMQNDVRQSMSAVALALKDIREHLNE